MKNRCNIPCKLSFHKPKPRCMKQMILLLSCLLLITGISVKAQNVVYDANAEVRKVVPFKGIDVSGGISVYLSQGSEQAVAVSAGEEKFVSKIKTEVRNGILKIFVESGAWNSWNWGNRKIKAYVTVTTLESLEASGASSVKMSGDLNIKDLSMEITGASLFAGVVKGHSISLEVSGASSVSLEGSLDLLEIEASGASSVKGYDLVTNFCKVEASGASAVKVTVNKELDAEASGASSIGYRGEAVVKRIDVSGASSIKKKDG